MFKLRPHQDEAVQAIHLMEDDTGRIVMPTGSGKTVVEATVLRDRINASTKTKIHLVVAPRIQLCNQLIKEYRAVAGQQYYAVAFHSGKAEPETGKVRFTLRSTTSKDNVREEIARAQRKNKDLVIFSTFHSMHKLKTIKFNTIIADESQYCVAEGNFEVVKELKSDLKLFFTATEKHTPSDSGRGLNNKDVFGPIIYQTTPAAMIKDGYIVPPRLHVMSADRASDKNSTIDEIKQLATKQMELSSEVPVNKILFAMNNTADVQTVVEKVADLKVAFPNHDIFTIVSNTKYGAMINGQKIARGDFMNELRECDNALIFHYDILSEGIDVDGITGVVLLRDMQHAKLLQTIGRAVRPYKANPDAKPQAWISVRSLNGDEESAQNVARIVTSIRDGGFEVNVENVQFTSEIQPGIADPDDIDDLVDIDRRAKAKAQLESVIHSIENAEALVLKQAEMTSTNTLESFFQALEVA